MTYPPNPRAGFYLALLASFSLACSSNPGTRTATPGDTTTTHISTATSTPPRPTPGAAPSFATNTTTTTNAPIPADLRFTSADIKYLQSLDPDARALAIQRQRENLAALLEAAKLTNGYTDSLRHWSISTAKKAR